MTDIIPSKLLAASDLHKGFVPPTSLSVPVDTYSTVSKCSQS